MIIEFTKETTISKLKRFSFELLRKLVFKNIINREQKSKCFGKMKSVA